MIKRTSTEQIIPIFYLNATYDAFRVYIFPTSSGFSSLINVLHSSVKYRGLYAYLPDGLCLIVLEYNPTGVGFTGLRQGWHGLVGCLVARASPGISIQNTLDEGDEGGEVCYRCYKISTCGHERGFQILHRYLSG